MSTRKRTTTFRAGACFLKPQEGGSGMMMSNTEVLGVLTKAYSSLKQLVGLSIKLGVGGDCRWGRGRLSAG